jgi:transcriptional regulator with XRE-family HTH domain
MSIDVGTIQDVPRFGRLIHQHRTRIGLTQRALADFSTISVRAIRDLEQGKARRPRQDTVRLIADGLRLGPRARVDLETAANQGLTSWALKSAYDADPPAPPTALDALVGRDSECSVIEGELSAGAERLITVVGMDGVGKTRLALEVAARLHAADHLPVLWFAFRDGFLEYRTNGAADRFSELVRACVDDIFAPCSSESMRPETSQDEDSDDIAGFIELVGDRPALLVVDGIGEQLLRHDRLVRLLTDCPGLRLLVTGPHPGGMPEERTFLLTPLETPTSPDECDPEALKQVPAVHLVLDRVRRTRPEYALSTTDVGVVAEICRQLDGLPRALRAAASWLVVYDMQTLHHCLHDDPASLLEHLTGAEGGYHPQDALGRCVRQLPEEDRALLDELCDRGEEFNLADVVALTGHSLPDSGRLVRDLVLHGVVRPSYETGCSPFQVLNVVRAFRSHCSVAPGRKVLISAGATAA